MSSVHEASTPFTLDVSGHNIRDELQSDLIIPVGYTRIQKNISIPAGVTLMVEGELYVP